MLQFGHYQEARVVLQWAVSPQHPPTQIGAESTSALPSGLEATMGPGPPFRVAPHNLWLPVHKSPPWELCISQQAGLTQRIIKPLLQR